jgi:Zn-dependent peptidase ImmA (M78 family)
MSKPTGVRADHKYSYKKLEKLAVYVRQKLQFRLDVALDPLRLFEDLHELSTSCASGQVIPLRGGVVKLENSEGYAYYNRSKRLIEILASERVYAWLEAKHPRAAYFITHELGHCLLHTDQLIRLAQMPTNRQAAFHRGQTMHKSFEDTEWQANAFASAVLMPAHGLVALEREYGYLDISLIAQRFGVSTEAAGYRLNCFTARKDELLK